MSDKLAWADTVSLCALHGVGVDERILEMWGHLRHAVLFIMRYIEGQHKQEHIDGAQEHLMRYTELVQLHFGMHELCTFQLHTLMAHAPEQAALCGPMAYVAEFWVERFMGTFKSIVKYRSTRKPELVAVNHWLTCQALERMLNQRPDAGRLYDAIHGGRNMDNRAKYDSTEGDCWLSGALTDVSDDDAVVSQPRR